jgi:hypothetical protein
MKSKSSKPPPGQKVLQFGTKRSDPDVASTSDVAPSIQCVVPDSPRPSPAVEDTGAGEEPDSRIATRLTFRQQQAITDAASYATYQGLVEKNGKLVHSWLCTVCADGLSRVWDCASDATRHARQSVRHQEKARQLSESRKAQKLETTVLKQRTEESEYLGTQSAKMLTIAAYILAENEAHNKFPKV